MYCRKCGKEIDDEAVVCPHCGVLTVRNGSPRFYGQPVQPVQPVQYNNAPAQQPVQTIVPYDDGLKSVNGLGIAGFVVGLVSLALGFFFCIPAVVGLIISIFAVINRKKYRACNGLATAGVVISAVALAGWFSFFARLFICLILFY